MSNLKLHHRTDGVGVTWDGNFLGVFSSEKEALYYLMSNNYLNIYIERIMDV